MVNDKELGQIYARVPLVYAAGVAPGVIVIVKPSLIAYQFDLSQTIFIKPCVMPSCVMFTAVGSAVCPKKAT